MAPPNSRGTATSTRSFRTTAPGRSSLTTTRISRPRPRAPARQRLLNSRERGEKGAAAVRRAEVVGLALFFGGPPGASHVDLHTTDGIDRHLADRRRRRASLTRPPALHD